MNKSMTGYGIAKYEDERVSISVEVRTLNSKFLDISLRLPRIYNNKEIEARNLIGEYLERGKVSVTIDCTKKEGATSMMEFNGDLFKKYYQELERLANDVGAANHDVFRLALQYPEVVNAREDDEEKDRDWALMLATLKEALGKCDEFRSQEGRGLTVKLGEYLANIEGALDAVEVLDPDRLQRIRNRITGNLQEVVKKEELDQNRLEQELIYYIEKLDISEEKVRLRSHLQYFSEMLTSKDSNGKKMNFLSQELGREINTIGSKANDAAIQKLVVTMKDELEKLKEQILNLL
jgi:uncharacterized protein (TIGR00255 family)